MLKSLAFIILIYPSVSFANTPLNSIYTLRCAFDESCKRDRVRWAFHEMQTQFVKAIFSYEQWLAMSQDEDFTPSDRLSISTMNLKNYNKQLGQFIEFYQFILRHSDHFIEEEQNVFLKVSYVLARLVVPDNLIVIEEASSLLEKSDFTPLTQLQSLKVQLDEIIENQQTPIGVNLLTGTHDEKKKFQFIYTIKYVQGIGVLACEITDTGIYIVSDLQVLEIVMPLVQGSVTKKVLDIDSYVKIKEAQGVLKDFLEQNSAGKEKAPLQPVSEGQFY